MKNQVYDSWCATRAPKYYQAMSAIIGSLQMLLVAILSLFISSLKLETNVP